MGLLLKQAAKNQESKEPRVQRTADKGSGA